MKKKLPLLILILAIFVATIASPYSAYADYIHPLDILAEFDAAHFIGVEDIDVTSAELSEIRAFFEDENVISPSNSKSKNHENIYRWIKNNIAYEQSSNRAYDVFTSKKGVCEGLSQLYKVLCHLCAIPNVISNGQTTFGAHAWNYVYLDEWHEIDITNYGFDDVFKTDLRHYEDEYLTPYLYKDDGFMYYYSHGICAKPLGENAEIPRKIGNLTVDSYDNYLPHYFSGYKNQSITTLNIYSGATYIDKNYFASFPNLTFLSGKNCADGIYYGQNGAFIPPKIQSVKINLPVIEKETFKDLQNLEKIEFLDDVKRVEQDAVVNCPNLKSIVFGDGIEEIDAVFANVTIYGTRSVCAEYAEKYGLTFVDTATIPLDTHPFAMPTGLVVVAATLIVALILALALPATLAIIKRKGKN